MYRNKVQKIITNNSQKKWANRRGFAQNTEERSKKSQQTFLRIQ
jgi:hypothetical protein